ncbi:MAG: hypothetical protein PHO04_02655 [Candidatus Pacebacteria bacterium]|jgi:hypothetical protein|nr:hypothetical protein [Candidatus Paceibacterota bacterium]MDD3918847.1 hypothetical protein [Candidatus Paceibacterota bacterium]MDD4664863.1 hypothetical protein [Candidatus Paceibacterota bacterium]
MCMKNNSVFNILRMFVVIAILICAVIAVFLILDISALHELKEALTKALLVIATLAIASLFTMYVLRLKK